jgi:hypothetical protein
MKRTILLTMVMLIIGTGTQGGVAQPTYHPTVSAMSYDTSFSIALHNTNVWRDDFYSAIVAAGAAKQAMFGKISGASRITPQEIQALCGPFPCSGPKPSIMGGERSASAYPQAPTYSSPAPRQYPITATDFQPVGGRILPNQIGSSPQEKEFMRMLSNQSLDMLEIEGRKNNVAYAFALLASISMQIVLARPMTNAENKQLVSGFNNALAADAQFASMSARDKQLLYEAATIAGGFMGFLHVQGKQQNDAKAQADIRAAAKNVLAALLGVKVE